MIVSEVKLPDVASQVSLTDVLVDAGQTALEDRKVVLNGVGVDVAANVLVGPVVNGVMLELTADAIVHRCTVGMHNGIPGDLLGHDRAQGLAADFVDVERADLPIAFDQREDFHLVIRATSRPLVFAEFVPPIGFVYLDNLARSTELLGEDGVFHGFADAVSHEPSGFVGNVQHAMNLMAGMPLLGGAQ